MSNEPKAPKGERVNVSAEEADALPWAVEAGEEETVAYLIKQKAQMEQLAVDLLKAFETLKPKQKREIMDYGVDGVKNSTQYLVRKTEWSKPDRSGISGGSYKETAKYDTKNEAEECGTQFAGEDIKKIAAELSSVSNVAVEIMHDKRQMDDADFTSITRLKNNLALAAKVLNEATKHKAEGRTEAETTDAYQFRQELDYVRTAQKALKELNSEVQTAQHYNSLTVHRHEKVKMEDQIATYHDQRADFANSLATQSEQEAMANNPGYRTRIKNIKAAKDTEPEYMI